ncbi:hypothetical protein Droror1_Dr00014603 [Drosera rotundifolia]
MKLRSPILCCLPPSPAASPFILRSLTTFSDSQTNHNNTQLHHLLRTFTPSSSSSSSRCYCSRIVRSSSTSGRDGAEDSLLDDHLIGRVSCLKDASEVLSVLGEELGRECGVLCASDCCRIIASALKRHNSDLAMSIFLAMRSSFDQDSMQNGKPVERWKWPRPDVNTFTSLVLGLSASLRVSDAFKVLAAISRIGDSLQEEVPFGMIVKCPMCTIALAVAQPQHGIQIVSCSKCRYQYELVSGDITGISSEEISMDIPAWKMGLRYLQIVNQKLPVAVHSLLIQTPGSVARTYRFATNSVDLPAQEGDRVTISLAAPSNVYREVGPFKFSPKSPTHYPGEPVCLTNHRDGREYVLLRVPSANRSMSLLSPRVLFPIVAVLAAGGAASVIIDPNLPQLVSYAALGSIAVGATINAILLPQFSQLPQRAVDVIAIKQELLAQYDTLQSHLVDLKEAAKNEVQLLARMHQLEHKIFAVGEPSYRARRTKVRRVRENLESSLKRRIKLMDSYARISSMIEIEVELDTDVPAAEAASNAGIIAKQIKQIMDLEHLEERWRQQAEANDEVERLLTTDALPS